MNAPQELPVDDLAFSGGSPPLLGEDEIHVWSADIVGSARHVAVTARSAQRQLLGRYAGSVGPPLLGRGPHGKPYAVDLPRLQFNLSHAGSHVLLAFAWAQPLGVDIEAIDRSARVDELARRFFAASEADALGALPETRRTQAFVRLWTHKEAVLKAIGEGIGFGLAQLEFSLTPDGNVGPLRRIASKGGAVSQWQVRALATVAGTTGALAWYGPLRRVRAGVLDQAILDRIVETCDAGPPTVV